MTVASAVPSQLVALGSNLHKISIMLFGYFMPALSSVKAVVQKDPDGYHQWSTYWLVLHLYTTLLSPVLHFTLHPVFQILAVLWLSLPRYRGASVIYERVIIPWVDRYESRVDEAVDEAHRGAMRWVLSRSGRMVWILIGEGGSAAEGLSNVVAEYLLGNLSGKTEPKKHENAPRPSDSTESHSLGPRNSIREALRQSSSIGEEGEVGEGPEETEEFVSDFTETLRRGLYVFSKIAENGESIGNGAEGAQDASEGGHELSVFSYAGDGGGEFRIFPAAAGGNEAGMPPPTGARLPLDDLAVEACVQGLILRSSGAKSRDKDVRVEIVLSDEMDRNILMTGINVCLSVRGNR